MKEREREREGEREREREREKEDRDVGVGQEALLLSEKYNLVYFDLDVFCNLW